MLGGGGRGALQRETAEEEARAAGGHDDEAYSDYDDCPQKMRGKRPYAYKRYVNEQKEAARLGVWAAKAAAAFTAEVAAAKAAKAAKAAEQAVPDSTAPEQAVPDSTTPEQAAEAAAIAAQSEQQKASRWAKQLEYARARKIYMLQQRAAYEATRRREQEIYAQRVAAGEWLPGMTTLLKPIPHAVVESEVIAASNPPLQAEAAGEAVDRAMEKAQPLAPGVAGAEQAEPDCSAAEQAAAIAVQSQQQKAAPLEHVGQPKIYVKIGEKRYYIRL